MSKHTSSDELDGLLDALHISPCDSYGCNQLKIKDCKRLKHLIAYIKTNYILKSDVVEAIEHRVKVLNVQGMDNIADGHYIKVSNLLESLNLEGHGNEK